MPVKLVFMHLHFISNFKRTVPDSVNNKYMDIIKASGNVTSPLNEIGQ